MQGWVTNYYYFPRIFQFHFIYHHHILLFQIPLSSQCHLLRDYYQTSSNHIIALNKADLASRSALQVRAPLFLCFIFSFLTFTAYLVL